MCGRYYIDKEMEKDIGRIVREVEADLARWRERDIRPTDTAPVIYGRGGILCPGEMKWGLSGRDKRPLINARAETARERPTFSESVMHRRCIVPARRFYEWDKEKRKVTFRYGKSASIYMAGFYRMQEDGFHFIIVTIAANESVRPVHDRMPLILEENEVQPWICEDDKVGFFLEKQSPMLEPSRDFEQMSLF